MPIWTNPLDSARRRFKAKWTRNVVGISSPCRRGHARMGNGLTAMPATQSTTRGEYRREGPCGQFAAQAASPPHRFGDRLYPAIRSNDCKGHTPPARSNDRNWPIPLKNPVLDLFSVSVAGGNSLCGARFAYVRRVNGLRSTSSGRHFAAFCHRYQPFRHSSQVLRSRCQ